MRNIALFSSALLIITFTLFSFSKPENNGHNGRCIGSANCSACSNCSRCGHCSSGGTCGVCRGSYSVKSFYSSSSSIYKSSKYKRNASVKNYLSRKTTSNPLITAQTISSANENIKVFFANKDVVNIYESPDFNLTVIDKIKEGQKVIQLEQGEEWLRIKVANSGTKGYVYKKNLRE